MKFTDIQPGSSITVKSWWGSQQMTAIGRGAYPYDCTSKDKHPQAMIFENSAGGWLGDYQLQPEANKYGQFETNY